MVIHSMPYAGYPTGNSRASACIPLLASHSSLLGHVAAQTPVCVRGPTPAFIHISLKEHSGCVPSAECPNKLTPYC